MIRRTATLCLAAALVMGVPPATSAGQANPRHPSAAGQGRGGNVDRAVPRAGGPGRPAGPPPSAYRGRPAYPPAYGRGPAYYNGWRGARFYAPGPVYYGRPYYAFRPHVSIGFGVWAGVAVPFPAFGFGIGVGGPGYGYGYGGYAAPYGYGVPPYAGAYPVPYPVPQPYPVPYPAPAAGYPGYGAYGQAGAYPPQTAVTARPAAPEYGGLSFEITPADAVVYVDGAYAGPVSSFGPASQPLSLTPGMHRIEIQAPGHQSLTFDVTISAGLVVPYRGTLPRAY
jgi:hypothetical protein